MTSAEADPRIEAAMRRVDELAGTSPEQHVAIYEDVHETLQQVLSEAGTAGVDAAAARPEDQRPDRSPQSPEASAGPLDAEDRLPDADAET